jgi:hypothetical protein
MYMGQAVGPCSPPWGGHWKLLPTSREMENISIEVLPSGILSLEALMQDVTVARLQSTRVLYRLPSPPSFKCNQSCE